MTQASPIRFDLLRTLHAFIMDMPEAQFNLNSVVDKEGDPKLLANGRYKECGAIACGMGWAGLLPAFQKEGLTWDKNLGTLRFDGKIESYDDAAVKLFNLPPMKKFYGPDDDDYNTSTNGYADVLFSPAGDGHYDEELIEAMADNGTDMNYHRPLFDARMRKFFAEFGQGL